MDFPVHTFVPSGGEPLSLMLHRPHKMHDGSLFAMHAQGVFQAVQCWFVRKEEQLDPDWERRYAHHDPAYTRRLRADHASATEFAVPPRMHAVATCPMLDPAFDPIDWMVAEVGRNGRANGFELRLHASQVRSARGVRQHLSIVLDFELIVAL